jgi:hypothetical protein
VTWLLFYYPLGALKFDAHEMHCCGTRASLVFYCYRTMPDALSILAVKNRKLHNRNEISGAC